MVGCPGRPRQDERGGGQGGRRLAAAFDSASRLPALAESCRRLLRASEREASSPGELTQAIESDVALTIAVMRAAGDAADAGGRAGGVPQAIEALSPPGVREVVASIDTYDPLDSPSARAEPYERFRRHAVATRHAADRIARAGAPSGARRAGGRGPCSRRRAPGAVGDVRAVREARRPEDGARCEGAVRASRARDRPRAGRRGPDQALGLSPGRRDRGRATSHAAGRAGMRRRSGSPT